MGFRGTVAQMKCKIIILVCADSLAAFVTEQLHMLAKLTEYFGSHYSKPKIEGVVQSDFLD